MSLLPRARDGAAKSTSKMEDIKSHKSVSLCDNPLQQSSRLTCAASNWDLRLSSMQIAIRQREMGKTQVLPSNPDYQANSRRLERFEIQSLWPVTNETARNRLYLELRMVGWNVLHCDADHCGKNFWKYDANDPPVLCYILSESPFVCDCMSSLHFFRTLLRPCSHLRLTFASCETNYTLPSRHFSVSAAKMVAPSRTGKGTKTVFTLNSKSNKRGVIGG